MSRSDGSLWAITSFFNPAGSRRRLENYRRFRAALPVPLATIELGFDGEWHLTSEDAELYVPIGDGDVLWQKERLLNVLLPRLPAECRHVAWLDADILLADRDWPRRAAEALARAPIVQLFSAVHYLDREGSQRDGGGMKVPSVVAEVQAGRAAAEVLARVTDRTGGASAGGMAWAARRELLERHGFYDANVIGGGDTALACAAYGVAQVAARLHHMNPMHAARYEAWASAFQRDVAGQVGLVDGEIRHLWHGELAARNTTGRHVALASQGFDPGADLVAGSQGAWRWSSAKPALHALLRDYFARRGDND
jgi:hypothetical protein